MNSVTKSNARKSCIVMGTAPFQGLRIDRLPFWQHLQTLYHIRQHCGCLFSLEMNFCQDVN